MLLPLVHLRECEVLQVLLDFVDVQFICYYLNLSLELIDHALIMLLELLHPVLKIVLRFSEADGLKKVLGQLPELLGLIYDVLLNIFEVQQ